MPRSNESWDPVFLGSISILVGDAIGSTTSVLSGITTGGFHDFTSAVQGSIVEITRDFGGLIYGWEQRMVLSCFKLYQTTNLL